MFVSKSSKALSSRRDGQKYGRGVVGARSHQNVVKKVKPEVIKSHFASLENLMDSKTEGCNKEGHHRGMETYSDKVGAEVWVKKKYVVGEASTSKAKGRRSQKGGNQSKPNNGTQADPIREKALGHSAGPFMKEKRGKMVAQKIEPSGKGKGGISHQRTNVVVCGNVGLGPKNS